MQPQYPMGATSPIWTFCSRSRQRVGPKGCAYETEINSTYLDYAAASATRSIKAQRTSAVRPRNSGLLTLTQLYDLIVGHKTSPMSLCPQFIPHTTLPLTKKSCGHSCTWRKLFCHIYYSISIEIVEFYEWIYTVFLSFQFHSPEDSDVIFWSDDRIMRCCYVILYIWRRIITSIAYWSDEAGEETIRVKVVFFSFFFLFLFFLALMPLFLLLAAWKGHDRVILGNRGAPLIRSTTTTTYYHRRIWTAKAWSFRAISYNRQYSPKKLVR